MLEQFRPADLDIFSVCLAPRLSSIFIPTTFSLKGGFALLLSTTNAPVIKLCYFNPSNNSAFFKSHRSYYHSFKFQQPTCGFR
jgi:hypothetical protein